MKKDLKMLSALVVRNSKIYFKDKLTFFLSLISPMILIVLFIAFLKNVYIGTLTQNLPEGVQLGQRLIDGFAGGWLFSSILGVSCVTVAFCSNMIIATDKINKNIQDFNITPVKKHIVNLSYLISNYISTFIVCFITMVVGLLYLACVGWYLSFVDVLLIIATMAIDVLFGSLLSTIICNFITSQGGISAISTIVSSMYGFISGAYMPLSQSGAGIKAIVSFIPGTYGTVLFRNFFMRGTVNELAKNFPPETISVIKESFDCTFSFFGTNVPIWAMFLILGASCAGLLGIYLLIVVLISKEKHKKMTAKR